MESLNGLNAKESDVERFKAELDFKRKCYEVDSNERVEMEKLKVRKMEVQWERDRLKLEFYKHESMNSK